MRKLIRLIRFAARGLASNFREDSSTFGWKAGLALLFFGMIGCVSVLLARRGQHEEEIYSGSTQSTSTTE